MNNQKVSGFVYISMSLITILTFSFAMIAIPKSGAFCPKDCFNYPYLNSFSQYPRDFIWMYLGIVLFIWFYVFILVIHKNTPKPNRIFSRIGLFFSGSTSLIMIIDYFVQVSVVPVSLKNNETQGLPLIIQYNPHGVFIALEEIGLILMSISFAFVGFVFDGKDKLSRIIKYLLWIPIIVTLFSFILITYQYGLDRKDRCEVIIISTNWIVLIISGFLIKSHTNQSKKRED